MQLKAYNISVLKTDFFSGSGLIHLCYHLFAEHDATGSEKDEECGKGATKKTFAAIGICSKWMRRSCWEWSRQALGLVENER